MDQRTQFIRDWLKHREYVSQLCARYGVSRKTGHKWIRRFMEVGPDGLIERGRAARMIANKTLPAVERVIVGLRQRHPSWGAKKLCAWLSQHRPQLELPHKSTVCEILRRHGLVQPRSRVRRVGHPGRPSLQVTQPNDCWSVDFKGQFRTGDGKYCYALTVTDNYSRYLLCCRVLQGTLHEPTMQLMNKLFSRYGLPLRIRSDNGVPFAAASLARLSRLSVWWRKLGIAPELIEPGKPQQNGRHERMHRTLKAETAMPPAASAVAQQRRFDAFRREYNQVRPHEALDMRTPAQLYSPSPRKKPRQLLQPQYPAHFEQRLVSANGCIRWLKHAVSLSSALIGEIVGLENVDEGQWDVYYGALRLGRLHDKHMRIEDHMARLHRSRQGRPRQGRNPHP
jgi:transposase InsO family protein